MFGNKMRKFNYDCRNYGEDSDDDIATFKKNFNKHYGNGPGATSTPLSSPMSLRFSSPIKYLIGKFNKHNDTLKFETKFRKVLISTFILIICYKFIVFLMPLTKPEILYDWSLIILKRMNDVLSSCKLSEENYNIFTSLACGIGITLFSCVFVYFNSYIPGIYPPLPFTPISRLSYRQQKVKAFHSGYITSIASGVVVSYLMLYGLKNPLISCYDVVFSAIFLHM